MLYLKKGLFHFPLLQLCFCLLLISACKEEVAQNQPEKPAPVVGSRQDTVNVPLLEGQIKWEASKLTTSHHGTLQIVKGNLIFIDSVFSGGDFMLDMKSLQADGISGEDKLDLEAHLKSADFFDVDQFPVGFFKIINCERVAGDVAWNHNLSGTLVLKGIGKNVKFPATVIEENGQITASTPEFTINRTDWGIQYKSGLVNTAKDQIISDEIKVKIQFTAGK